MANLQGPARGDEDRVARALGARVVTWEPATRGGQTAAARWLVTLQGGGRAFVKIGATQETAAWIRDEHLVYAQLRGRAFLPRIWGSTMTASARRWRSRTSPEEILPGGAPEAASVAAGYFCAHAGRPPIPEAPHIRALQLMQARTALPRAARELGLPPPT